MMNNIQKYIELLKSEKDKANKRYNKIKNHNSVLSRLLTGEIEALSFCITNAELLLLNEPKAITETALSANTMLGDSAASLESSTIEEVAAVSSETRGVRQNEQIQKDCTTCRHNGTVAWRDRCQFCTRYDVQGFPLWEGVQSE